MVARRSVSRPDEISYYIAYCRSDTTLDQLIRIACSRWAVEECFQSEAGGRDGTEERLALVVGMPCDPDHGPQVHRGPHASAFYRV